HLDARKVLHEPHGVWPQPGLQSGQHQSSKFRGKGGSFTPDEIDTDHQVDGLSHDNDSRIWCEYDRQRSEIDRFRGGFSSCFEIRSYRSTRIATLHRIERAK